MTDGLSGLPEAIIEMFPESKHQQCLAHVSRKISSHVRINDHKEIIQDFKNIEDTLESIF